MRDPDKIRAYQRRRLSIEPDVPVMLDGITTDFQQASDGLCGWTEPYFQDAVHAYHHDDTHAVTGNSTVSKIGGVAVFKDGVGVGVLKNYGHNTLLCTQSVMNSDLEYELARGFIYSVDANTKSHAEPGFKAESIDELTYDHSRPLNDFNLQYIIEPNNLWANKDLLGYADAFIQEQRRQRTTQHTTNTPRTNGFNSASQRTRL